MMTKREEDTLYIKGFMDGVTLFHNKVLDFDKYDDQILREIAAEVKATIEETVIEAKEVFRENQSRRKENERNTKLQGMWDEFSAD